MVFLCRSLEYGCLISRPCHLGSCFCLRYFCPIRRRPSKAEQASRGGKKKEKKRRKKKKAYYTRHWTLWDTSMSGPAWLLSRVRPFLGALAGLPPCEAYASLGAVQRTK